MSSLFVSFLPVLFILIGLGILMLVVYWLRWSAVRRTKRPPFTRNLLRSPGESLRRQVDEAQLDLVLMVMTTMYAPLVVGSGLISQGASMKWGTALILGLVVVGVLGYLASKISKHFNRRNLLRLAWEGERAVGEELNQLMLQGYRVYHDFPAENFNIDHVVVGPKGVFAVETKTRSKAPRGSGVDAAKVKFDGKSLSFPDHQDKSAIEQADRQASWLAKWLAQSVGEGFAVIPVVVLPGWYVEVTAVPRRVFVLGSGSISTHFLTLGSNRLTAQQIQRIVYQVEQRCRTVEPWTPARMKKAA